MYYYRRENTDDGNLRNKRWKITSNQGKRHCYKIFVAVSKSSLKIQWKINRYLIMRLPEWVSIGWERDGMINEGISMARMFDTFTLTDLCWTVRKNDKDIVMSNIPIQDKTKEHQNLISQNEWNDGEWN